MDNSKIQPICKKFDNEFEAEKWLANLSLLGGKKVDVITIYRSTKIVVWFYYDRDKLGFSNEDEPKKKTPPKKKARKKKTE